jgi:hypothetical protein
MGVFPLKWDGDKPEHQFGTDTNPRTGVSPVRGVHAQNPSITPKWYDGKVEGEYRDNLARLYLPLKSEDKPKFLASVSAISKDADAALLAEGLLDKGYVDFFLSNVTRVHTEKAEVIEHQAGGFVSYFFGAAAETYNFSGVLLNSCEDDQAVNFYKIYKYIIRGTELARRRALIYMRYDSYFVGGTLMNYQDAFAAENEMVMPFSFSLLVHSMVHRVRRGDGRIRPTPLQTECDPTNSLTLAMATVTLKDNYVEAYVPPLKARDVAPTTDPVDANTKAEQEIKPLDSSASTVKPTGSAKGWIGPTSTPASWASTPARRR